MHTLPPSHHLGGGAGSPGAMGGGMGQFDHGGALAAVGIGGSAAPGAGASTNPIDPYGWLLTPTAMESPETTKGSSAGTSTAHTPVMSGSGKLGATPTATTIHTTPSSAATPLRHGQGHGHSLSSSNPHNFMAASPGQLAGLAAPGNGVEGQAMFDWEGILQTIGSGWTGDGQLETGMESLFG